VNESCKDEQSAIGILDKYMTQSYRVMCSLFCPCQLMTLPYMAEGVVISKTGVTRIQDCLAYIQYDKQARLQDVAMYMETKY
jgi:hypothetical protein